MLDLGSGGSGGSTIGPPEVMRGQFVKIEPVTPRITSKPALIRLGRRHEYLPPENLLIKWRSHAGCGFNMSTMCLLLHLHSNTVLLQGSAIERRPEVALRTQVGSVFAGIVMIEAAGGDHSSCSDSARAENSRRERRRASACSSVIRPVRFATVMGRTGNHASGWIAHRALGRWALSA